MALLALHIPPPARWFRHWRPTRDRPEKLPRGQHHIATFAPIEWANHWQSSQSWEDCFAARVQWPLSRSVFRDLELSGRFLGADADAVVLHSAPNTASSNIFEIENDTRIELVGGPYCTEDHRWWRIALLMCRAAGSPMATRANAGCS